MFRQSRPAPLAHQEALFERRFTSARRLRAHSSRSSSVMWRGARMRPMPHRDELRSTLIRNAPHRVRYQRHLRHPPRAHRGGRRLRRPTAQRAARSLDHCRCKARPCARAHHGPRGFERTVVFAIDDAPAIIEERLGRRLGGVGRRPALSGCRSPSSPFSPLRFRALQAHLQSLAPRRDDLNHVLVFDGLSLQECRSQDFYLPPATVYQISRHQKAVPQIRFCRLLRTAKPECHIDGVLVIAMHAVNGGACQGT